MARYIVRFSGKEPPAEVLAGIKASPHLALIDRTPRMLLVEGPEEAVRKVVAADPAAKVIPEVTDYAIPDPKPRLK